MLCSLAPAQRDAVTALLAEHGVPVENQATIIRRASIDELPQIWNVLIGEMSLVGPRPPLPKEVEKYTLDDRRRLDVKPGLTCLWQVQGRAEIPFKQQVELDVEYIQNQSVSTDVKLLAKTLPAVIKGKGAS